MSKKHDRDSNGKTQMPGLVTKQLHGSKTPKASTKRTKGQQGGFWDAPKIFSGAVVVQKHNQEG